MKKLLLVALCVGMLCAFSSCTDDKTSDAETADDVTVVEADGEEDIANVPNPIKELTAEEFAEQAGLKNAEVEGATSYAVINGSDTVYEIYATVDGVDYNIRIAKGTDDELNEDITGIYLADLGTSFFLYGEEDGAPEVMVREDSDYAKAYGKFNGYRFGISRSATDDPEAFYEKTVDFITKLLASDNIK